MEVQPTNGSSIFDLWTIGHSTRTAAEFLNLLRVEGIESVLDVRSLPGSRRFPQFNAAAMSSWLADGGIHYCRAAALGGRRPRQKNIDPALNAGWMNTSFRNYADWTLSDTYLLALSAVAADASQVRTALMCSEAVPWRCHRSIIASNLVARGQRVGHIIDARHLVEHAIGRWGPRGIIAGQTVTYPA